MRDIKYRVWDGRVGKMTNFGSGNWVSEGAFNLNFYPADEKIILMQYTGLKDKNGVEIYEGDIVRVSYRGGDGHPTAIGWVDYLKPGFIVRTNEDTTKPYFLCLYAYNSEPLFNWSESVVIGNIYENKELLDGTD